MAISGFGAKDAAANAKANAKAGLANAGAAAKAGLANAGAAAKDALAGIANNKEGLPTLLPGFRITVLMVLIGLVAGFIIVGIIYVIHYTESTKKMLIFISIIVLIIFGVCIKKSPRAYLFSLLSIVMLLAAMGFGFIYDFPFPFRVVAGCLALGAGLIKVYFY
jgi:hypothetical protein